jgi:hypothetical protein
LLSLLWSQGLSLETTTATAIANPGSHFIAKPDKTVNLDIDAAMLIAVVVVYLLIGIDLLEHLNVTVTMTAQISLLIEQGYLIEGIYHFGLICIQMQYSLLIAWYSFYVIF